MANSNNKYDIYEDLFNAFMPPPAVKNEPACVPEPEVRVHWDDVIGQGEAKAALREAIEGANKHAEIYKRYGRRPTKGILLYGPAGNGKTMLGKAAAFALSAQHGGRGAGEAFIYLKGPEILDKWLGESEKKIRTLFDHARAHKKKHGYTAIIFIDEAESILGHRTERGMSSTIVPTFLAEMDGMEDSGAIVILATNRPGSIDSAIIREGRIDRKILVGRPSRDDAEAIFATYLKGRPGGTAALASTAADLLYDPAHVLYRFTLNDGKTKVATLASFAGAAQIAYLVDAAASFAIEREIETGKEGRIVAGDFRKAIERTLREQRELDHPTELVDFCAPFLSTVTAFERVAGDGTVVGRKSLIQDMPKGVEIAMPTGVTVPTC